MRKKYKKIDRHFVSPYDIFLDDMRQKLPESASQKAERIKHEQIFDKRDNPDADDKDKVIWSQF